ncbi:MAG: beta-propeller fold lactonase family protein [Gemmatimonadota bacterium]
MTDVLYAAVSGDAPCLDCFRIGSEGIAEPASRTLLPGGPADLALSPGGRFLYVDVGVGKVHQALSFRVDAASGALEPIGTPAHVGPYPCYISVDGSGRFLLAAYYSDGMVTVHAIGPDGVVGEPVQKLESAPRAHFIQTDAANCYAFAPHVCNENAIWQFRFDARTGQLTPNDVPKASPGPGHGPRHMCFHPNGRFAFSNGEQGSSVTAWSYAAGAGHLAPLQSLSTLPEGWAGDNTCSQIHLTPDGRFLYSCNRGHHSLAGFAVDGATGGLTALGQFPAEPTPRPTAISPDGRWLFNAGGSPRLVCYRIDGKSGALERTGHLEPGPVAWLLAARLG